MSAAIYTQTTDVESEVNGYLTYDRAVEKFDAAALRKLHAEMYKPVPPTRTIVPDAREARTSWRYTMKEPGQNWMAADFNDNGWQQGPGAFLQAPDGVFPEGTKWTADSIWLRKTFDVSAPPRDLFLSLVNGFTEGEVFLNGASILKLTDVRPARRHHTHFDVSAHAKLLKKGANVIAVRATHKPATRVVDAGLYTIGEGRR